MASIPKIDNNIPIPEKKHRNPMYDMLDQMKVGDSFHVEFDKAGNTRTFIARFKLDKDNCLKVFISRKEGIGYRFWRTQ